MQFCENHARDMPVWGIYIQRVLMLLVKILVKFLFFFWLSHTPIPVPMGMKVGMKEHSLLLNFIHTACSRLARRKTSKLL